MVNLQTTLTAKTNQTNPWEQKVTLQIFTSLQISTIWVCHAWLCSRLAENVRNYTQISKDPEELLSEQLKLPKPRDKTKRIIACILIH